jgi:pentatricopeptide repeat protein
MSSALRVTQSCFRCLYKYCYIAQIICYVGDSMKTFDKNMTWAIYADLKDLSDFFNIPYERINEIFKGLCSKKKRPDEAMTALRKMLKAGVK